VVPLKRRKQLGVIPLFRSGRWMRAVKVAHWSWVPARVTRVELESGFLPTPAGSAALSVSWRARSRQIRDHHRAQRRGSSRRYKRRL